MKALLFAGLLVLPLVALADAPAELLGDWWTPGFGARVRIEPCGDAVCGRIVWVWDTAPDIADKTPLIGRKVVEGMRPQGSGRWSAGQLYNPEDGRHYQGSLHLRSAENLVLEGCVLLFCQKQVWRRADPAGCPAAGPAGRSQAINAAVVVRRLTFS
jgi:uncharacterized protein (DUF2147 family)